jgi:hypothetical protein
MSDSAINAVLFCVIAYFVLRSTALSLEFLERMRAKQNKKRLKEQEVQDRAAGTHKRVEYVETARGYLLDETGEPAKFLIDKYRDWCSRVTDYQRAQYMVDKIDSGGMGLIYPTTMVDYYRAIPTLKPVG